MGLLKPHPDERHRTMTDYRVVLRHARFWRGAVHRWSTSYEFTGSGPTPDSTACDQLSAQENKLIYSPLTGNTLGGVSEVTFYLASGGTPVTEKVYYDWTTPASWIVPPTSVWSPRTTAIESNAEVALDIRWAAGLSSSGKPVFFRKWIHAVPLSASTGSTPDVGSTQLSALVTQANVLSGCLQTSYGLVMGNARRIAGTPSVLGFYGNHQMPRGRRRKPLVTASGKYQGPSVIVGEPPAITFGTEN
jgi:hypothetical protein